MKRSLRALVVALMMMNSASMLNAAQYDSISDLVAAGVGRTILYPLHSLERLAKTGLCITGIYALLKAAAVLEQMARIEDTEKDYDNFDNDNDGFDDDDDDY